MNSTTLLTTTSLLIAFATGCSSARTPEQYSADTRSALAAKSGAVKACYDDELKNEKAVSGLVKVRFTV